MLSKLLESIVRDHILDHLLHNNLITNSQYGFVPKRSTSLQLLYALDMWTNYLEEGGQIVIVYTDFEKAFDKVPHERLLYKIGQYGIGSDVVAWIRSF